MFLTRPHVPAPYPAWRPILWAIIATLLITPAVAMRFTSEVRWGVEDFAAAALLLGAVGTSVELTMRFVARPFVRLLICAIVSGAVLSIWADAAVGIF
ncbi:hypothetical protein WG907_07280 [Sphingobium sp. AN558]|uniref:hypothetical protein n=1 Tax=Sphingobium sp. AN558 TaxID=3133442 RepID=UPI0030C004DC